MKFLVVWRKTNNRDGYVYGLLQNNPTEVNWPIEPQNSNDEQRRYHWSFMFQTINSMSLHEPGAIGQ